MSDTTASLQRKIASARDLQSVVRTMKAMAAASVGQYEKAVISLNEYYRTVQLGLTASLRDETNAAAATDPEQAVTAPIGVIVFGSDQGLVGQFNDVMVDFVESALAKLPGEKIVWAVGERIQSRLAETSLATRASFVLPKVINAITPLVGEILTELETYRQRTSLSQVYVFHHRPCAGALYDPVSQRLLPLDRTWQQTLTTLAWPSKALPEILNDPAATFLAFVREYLFVSLFRACAESLSSENASRLAAMQRAEKNIDELLEDLRRGYHHLRQSSIDEELFEVVSAFEALGKP
ncbi:F0F1 ATP synthase subunit gamma [Uliginosibacterium gangwonense]|uniref:F0F1 ATP synthase subunit gamma n=1 Tax=Uliginosibacterium gangwonense TaxID=392736 RepID=UPI0003633336|nr:F0F1 ATP synthase subunit gamma [Uliginosibacterium gangwonense]